MKRKQFFMKDNIPRYRNLLILNVIELVAFQTTRIAKKTHTLVVRSNFAGLVGNVEANSRQPKTLKEE